MDSNREGEGVVMVQSRAAGPGAALRLTPASLASGQEMG